ncbi:MAG: SdrD B-like domain-containing protein [Candidatus Hydrothermales bacterium]
MKLIIYIILLRYFSFSIYSQNQFYPSYYGESYYFSSFYSQKDFDLSLRFIKTNNFFYLDNLNLNFLLNKKKISIFDLNFYLYSPFGVNKYLRGLKFSDKNFIFLIGKRRNTGEVIPDFTKNEYLIYFDYLFLKTLSPFKFSFLVEKDFNKNAIILFSNYVKYSSSYFDIEKAIGFSLVDFYLGAATEARISHLKENRGFNLVYKLKTKKYGTFYDSKDYYLGIFSSSFLRIKPFLTYTGKFHYFNSNSFNFLNENDIKINLKFLPIITLMGGFEINKNILFVRGFEVSYSKKYINVTFNHRKLREERNHLRFEFRKSPFSYEFAISKKDYFRFLLDYNLKNNFYFSIAFGREKSNKLYSSSFRLNYLSFNILTSFVITKVNDKSYANLSFSLSGAFLTQEVGFGRVYGFIFIDENGNFKYDPGEKPAKNIKVVIDNKRELITNEYGKFNFSFLKPGIHKIEIKYGAFPKEVGSSLGEKIEFEIGIFGVKNFYIPLVSLGEIEGIVFLDKNKNGKKDNDEDGLRDVVILVNGNSSITDENGKFHLNALIPGTYEIKILSVPIINIVLSPPILIKILPGEKISGINIPVQTKDKKVIYKKF